VCHTTSNSLQLLEFAGHKYIIYLHFLLDKGR
jgi:hypothetical protein